MFVSNNLLSIKTGFISVKKKDNPLAGMSEPISSDFVWGLGVLEFDEGENSLFGGLRFDVREFLFVLSFFFFATNIVCQCQHMSIKPLAGFIS